MKMIVLIADGLPIQSMKVNPLTATLSTIRAHANENPNIPFKLSYSLLFVKDGKLIDSAEEAAVKLANYLKPEEFEVHLNSQLNAVTVLIDDKRKETLKVPLAFSLTSLRNLSPAVFALHLTFFKNDKAIRHIDESKLRISDIISNNTIHIRSEKGKTEQWQDDFKSEEPKKRKSMKENKEPAKQNLQQEQEQYQDFTILIDKQKKVPAGLDINQKLSKLRELFPQIKDAMSFAWKNGPIADQDEEEIKIVDILDEAPQSAFAIINKKDQPKGKPDKDTVNVSWIAEKNLQQVKDTQSKNQKQETLGACLEQFLNAEAISMSSIPKGALLDPDGNPADSIYDLGKDGMFTGYKILIGAFYTGEGLVDNLKTKTACLALQTKGFTVNVVTTENEFATLVPEYDQIWIISNSSTQSNTYIDAVKKHLAQKKGLLIWGDNTPYIAHANQLLNELNVGKVKIQLEGNDYGTKMLQRTTKAKADKETFTQHQITAGIFRMNEGITICYPTNKDAKNSNNLGDLVVVGVGSAGRPSYMVLEGNENRGRIIIDCGFTKLYPQYWNGNWRYVRNCAVWLLWLEYLIN